MPPEHRSPADLTPALTFWRGRRRELQVKLEALPARPRRGRPARLRLQLVLSVVDEMIAERQLLEAGGW